MKRSKYFIAIIERHGLSADADISDIREQLFKPLPIPTVKESMTEYLDNKYEWSNEDE